MCVLSLELSYDLLDVVNIFMSSAKCFFTPFYDVLTFLSIRDLIHDQIKINIRAELPSSTHTNIHNWDRFTDKYTVSAHV